MEFRARCRFAGHALMEGIDAVGAGVQHNRIVGTLALLTFFGITVPVVSIVSAAWLPPTLVVVVTLSLLTLEGAYRLLHKHGGANSVALGELRTQLAVYVQQGQAIVAKCSETSRTRADAPVEEAEAWVGEVFAYLQEHLGDDYAVRFDNPEGLPMGTTFLMPPYSRVEGSIRFRLARLHEIMQELATRK